MPRTRQTLGTLSEEMRMKHEAEIGLSRNSLALCHFKVLKRLLVKLKITIQPIFELSQLHQVQLGQVHSLKFP